MSVRITNRLLFSGKPERIAKVFDAIKSDEKGIGTLDYNKLLPMPEELNIECSSAADRGFAHYKDFVSSYALSKGITGVDYLNIPEEDEKHYLKHFINVPKEEWELGKKAFRNQIKYGARDWYHWSIMNWGVKSNAYGFKPPETRSDNKISFDSPDYPPHKIIRLIAEKYPDIQLTHEWTSEELGKYCGTKIYRDGVLAEEIYPETEMERCDFAVKVYEVSTPEELGITMNADGTAYIRITADDYELIEIEDQKALFTNEKLYTSTIPKGMYCYHLRHDDVGGINFVALEKYVCVNHGGSIITKEPIDFCGKDFIKITEENYPNFLGEGDYTLQEFMNGDYEINETTEGMNMS